MQLPIEDRCAISVDAPIAVTARGGSQQRWCGESQGRWRGARGQLPVQSARNRCLGARARARAGACCIDVLFLLMPLAVSARTREQMQLPVAPAHASSPKDVRTSRRGRAAIRRPACDRHLCGDPAGGHRGDPRHPCHRHLFNTSCAGTRARQPLLGTSVCARLACRHGSGQCAAARGGRATREPGNRTRAPSPSWSGGWSLVSRVELGLLVWRVELGLLVKWLVVGLVRLVWPVKWLGPVGLVRSPAALGSFQGRPAGVSAKLGGAWQGAPRANACDSGRPRLVRPGRPPARIGDRGAGVMKAVGASRDAPTKNGQSWG